MRVKRGYQWPVWPALIAFFVSVLLASCATYESRSDKIRAHKDQALALMNALGQFPGGRTVLAPVEYDCWQGICDAKDGQDDYGAEALFELEATTTAAAVTPHVATWLERIGTRSILRGSTHPCTWSGAVGADQAVIVILANSLDEVRASGRKDGYGCSDPGKYVYVSIGWGAPPSITKL